MLIVKYSYNFNLPFCQPFYVVLCLVNNSTVTNNMQHPEIAGNNPFSPRYLITYELSSGPKAAPKAPLAITAEVNFAEFRIPRQIATVTGQMGPAAMPIQITNIVAENVELQNVISRFVINIADAPKKAAGQSVHFIGRIRTSVLPKARPVQNIASRQAAELAGISNLFSKNVLIQHAVEISIAT